MVECPQGDCDQTYYIIGDIHGRLDALDCIVDEIHRDMEIHRIKDATTITLGDYVDRGPDSCAVIDRLVRNPFPSRYIALRGNHEWMLSAFLYDPSIAHQWRQFGGLETLRSYGVAVDQVMVGKGYDESATALRARIPPAHLS